MINNVHISDNHVCENQPAPLAFASRDDGSAPLASLFSSPF